MQPRILVHTRILYEYRYTSTVQTWSGVRDVDLEANAPVDVGGGERSCESQFSRSVVHRHQIDRRRRSPTAFGEVAEGETEGRCLVCVARCQLPNHCAYWRVKISYNFNLENNQIVFHVIKLSVSVCLTHH